MTFQHNFGPSFTHWPPNFSDEEAEAAEGSRKVSAVSFEGPPASADGGRRYSQAEFQARPPMSFREGSGGGVGSRRSSQTRRQSSRQSVTGGQHVSGR